jgi:hypothetical protein
MSDNLTTLSFNTTHHTKPLFSFDNSSFILHHRRRNKAIFRRRKRKVRLPNTIITRYGKIPSELYPYYQQQMSCLEDLKALCVASNYSDLADYISEGLDCLTFYATQKTIVDFLEEYEEMTEGILDLAIDYDKRAGSEEGKSVILALETSSKDPKFTEELLQNLRNFPS